MYWFIFMIVTPFIIARLNLYLQKYVPTKNDKYKYLFSGLPFLLAAYYFIHFWDSPTSMEGIHEAIWCLSSIVVGRVSIFFTKYYLKKALL